jgi:proline racemase
VGAIDRVAKVGRDGFVVRGDRFRSESVIGSSAERPMANTTLERTIGRSWC